jgi:hypothetical protein
MKKDELLIEIINFYSEWIETVERPEIFLIDRLADKLVEARSNAEYYKKLYENEIRSKTKHKRVQHTSAS